MATKATREFSRSNTIKKEAGSFAIFVPEGKAERHHQAAFSQRAGRFRVSNFS